MPLKKGTRIKARKSKKIPTVARPLNNVQSFEEVIRSMRKEYAGTEFAEELERQLAKRNIVVK